NKGWYAAKEKDPDDDRRGFPPKFKPFMPWQHEAKDKIYRNGSHPFHSLLDLFFLYIIFFGYFFGIGYTTDKYVDDAVHFQQIKHGKQQQSHSQGKGQECFLAHPPGFMGFFHYKTGKVPHAVSKDRTKHVLV